MSNGRVSPSGHRTLFLALGFFELTHALSLLAMLVLLMPGLSPHVAIEARARYITEHVASWRVGWMSWQLSALSDVWLTLALLAWARAIDAKRAVRWAVAAVPLLVLALVPDQYAEIRLITDFVRATTSASWHDQLRLYMRLSGIWACLAYTLMTMCWLQASHHFRASSARVRPHVRGLEASVLVAFLGAAIANHVAWHASGESRSAFDWAVALNAYAFGGLLVSVGAIAVRAKQAARGASAREPLDAPLSAR